MKILNNFSLDEFFNIPITQLVPARPINFPIYIYFPLNKKMFLRYYAQHPPLEADLAKYQAVGVSNFFCPHSYKPEWEKYLRQQGLSEAEQGSKAASQLAGQQGADIAGTSGDAGTGATAGPNASAALEASLDGGGPEGQAGEEASKNLDEAQEIENERRKKKKQAGVDIDGVDADQNALASSDEAQNAAEEASAMETTDVDKELDIDIDAAIAEANSKAEAAGLPEMVMPDLSEELESAKEAIQADNLSTEEKKKILADLGGKMIGVLSEFADGSKDQKEQALKECKKMTDDVVRVAMQSHKMKSAYEDLIMLREADVEHSSAVSTLAVIFAMALGFESNEELADISMGGLLHDLGHSQIDLDVLSTPFINHTEDEKAEFKKHTGHGADLLEELGEMVTPLVVEIIQGHHERFDGKGYPAALRGDDIDERVQIVGLANLIDDLMSGRYTAQEMGPLEAFEWVRGQEKKEAGVMYFNPQIFESVYQIVLESKPKAVEARKLEERSA